MLRRLMMAGSSGGSVGFSDAVLGFSPWGYWKLNDASGSVAADSSGNVRNGTIAGTVTLGVSGVFAGTGNAMNLAASGASSSGRINLPTTAKSQLAGGRVMSILVNFKTSASGLRHLLSADAETRSWQFRLNGGAVDVITFSPVFGDTHSFPGSFNDGKPHQLVAVFDERVDVANGQIKVYADGVLLGRSTKAGSYSPADSYLYPAIGVRGTNYASEPYDGVMDDCALFFTALSASDVAALWAARNSP